MRNISISEIFSSARSAICKGVHPSQTCSYCKLPVSEEHYVTSDKTQVFCNQKHALWYTMVSGKPLHIVREKLEKI